MEYYIERKEVSFGGRRRGFKRDRFNTLVPWVFNAAAGHNSYRPNLARPSPMYAILRSSDPLAPFQGFEE
jgi:hypothetical protein